MLSIGCTPKKLPKDATILLLHITYHFPFNTLPDSNNPIPRWTNPLTKKDKLFFNSITTKIHNQLNLQFEGGLVPTQNMDFPPSLLSAKDTTSSSQFYFTPTPYRHLKTENNHVKKELLRFMDADILLTLDINITPLDKMRSDAHPLDLFSKMSYSEQFRIECLFNIYDKKGKYVQNITLTSTFDPQKSDQFNPILFNSNIPLLTPYGIMRWDLENEILKLFNAMPPLKKSKLD
mgnify:CR=1 FL=1